MSSINVTFSSKVVAANGVPLLKVPQAPPTCSGPEEMEGLELSRLDSTFFRGLGACELSLSNDVHLFTG